MSVELQCSAHELPSEGRGHSRGSVSRFSAGEEVRASYFIAGPYRVRNEPRLRGPSPAGLDHESLVSCSHRERQRAETKHVFWVSVSTRQMGRQQNMSNVSPIVPATPKSSTILSRRLTRDKHCLCLPRHICRSCSVTLVHTMQT